MDLIAHSLILTAQHPLFGVGMYQFPNASADLSVSRGQTPMWHTVHSFVLLVLAETGIPGGVLYTAAFFFCLTATLAVSRMTRKRKELIVARELSETMFYSFIGFITFMLFSPSAYLFHFPLMAALVSALHRLTSADLAHNAVPAPARRVPTPSLALPRYRTAG
jgi:O-antigen ligase